MFSDIYHIINLFCKKNHCKRDGFNSQKKYFGNKKNKTEKSFLFKTFFVLLFRKK